MTDLTPEELDEALADALAEVERLKSDVAVALEGWNITRDEMGKLVQYHIDRASAAEAKFQRLQSDVGAALTAYDKTKGEA